MHYSWRAVLTIQILLYDADRGRGRGEEAWAKGRGELFPMAFLRVNWFLLLGICLVKLLSRRVCLCDSLYGAELSASVWRHVIDP